MWQLFGQFLSFLKQEKKWRLIPLVVVRLMLVGLTCRNEYVFT